MEKDQKLPIFKISLISVISNLLFLLSLGVIITLYVLLFDPRIEIKDFVIRTGKVVNTSGQVRDKKDIKAFNDSNWKIYVQEWGLAKESATFLVDCIRSLETLHNSVEEKHKEYLRSNIEGVPSKEQGFYEGVYRGTDVLISELSNYTYISDQDEPYFIPTLFVNEDDPSSSKESATERLNEARAEFSRLRSIADNISCVLPKAVVYEQKNEMCRNLIDLKYSLLNSVYPVSRDSFEIDEQYEVAIKRREEEKSKNLETCRQDGDDYMVNFY